MINKKRPENCTACVIHSNVITVLRTGTILFIFCLCSCVNCKQLLPFFSRLKAYYDLIFLCQADMLTFGSFVI